MAIDLDGINMSDVVGVSMRALDIHNRLSSGHVVEVHLDNGEVIRLTKTNQTSSVGRHPHGITKGLLMTSNTRVLGIEAPSVNMLLELGHSLFPGEPDDKLVITAIIVLPGKKD